MPPVPTVTSQGAGLTTASGDGVVRMGGPGWLFLMGDSKTAPISTNTWPRELLLMAPAPAPWTIQNAGISGTNLGSTSQPVNLAIAMAVGTIVSTPIVCINLGVNEFNNFTTDPGGTFGATMIADYLIILDAIRAKWPDCRIYLAKPWRAGGYEGQANLFAGWVDTVIASRANVFPGPDERGYYKGSDDGVTNTVDGVHPSVIGSTAIAQAWKAILWP